MDIKDIKPIPKYILKLIKRKDNQNRINIYRPQLRFYSYLTKFNKELAMVTVAVRNHNKNWYCKQVIVHGIDSKECFLKDIMFNNLCGYKVGWYQEGLQKRPRWYEHEEWVYNDDKYFYPYSPVVNREYALKIKELKYSIADKYSYNDFFKYLRTFKQYPQAEYLMKIGLSYYATSKMILKKIAKDKNFRKWLMKNSNQIALKEYYVETILTAYKENRDLDYVQRYQGFLKSFIHENCYQRIKQVFKDDIRQFFEYITKQNITHNLYIDYLNACEYLNLDMNEVKNRIPHDFKHWHDIRIDEYTAAKAKDDKKKKKEFYKKFASIAEKYLPLQQEKDMYLVIIAKSPAELIKEGDILHHCVGKMGYDQKFAREESLIFFIRNKETPNSHFITIEYSIKNKKILQCYGDHNSQPQKEVFDYIRKTWLPYANRQLKNIA